MYLEHRMVVKIAGILSKINMNVMLLDNNGRVILPEGNDREFTLPEVLRGNPTQSLVYGGFTLIGTEGAQPLFLCFPGDSPDVASCAVLCAELINVLVKMNFSHVDREHACRSILREEVEGAELEALAMEHEIPLERGRCVIVLHLSPNIDTETALNILQNVAPEDGSDLAVEIDRHTVVLVKTLEEHEDYEEMEQLGLAIESTFVNETSYSVYIGIGEPKKTLSQLSESFREARRSIDVGRIYHRERYVFVYRTLVLERFLADIPFDMSQRYSSTMFNRKTVRLFNEEMMNTIEKFFENSLNLSETARQIYIHRNTLVYRLDKIQRITGLDLRAFDDAVTFKTMMLLGKNVVDRGKWR